MSCGPNAVNWMSPEMSAVRASAKRWNITISIWMLYFAASPGSSHSGESAGTLSIPCLIFTGAGSRARSESDCAIAAGGPASIAASRTGKTARIVMLMACS